MVHAVKVANGQKGKFSEEAWALLPVDSNGLRDGWKQVDPEPPKEVKETLKSNTGKKSEAKQKDGKKSEAKQIDAEIQDPEEADEQ